MAGCFFWRPKFGRVPDINGAQDILQNRTHEKGGAAEVQLMVNMTSANALSSFAA